MHGHALFGYYIIPACWLIFLLYWTLASFSAKKKIWVQSRFEGLPYRLLIGLAFWLIFVPFKIRLLEATLFPPNEIAYAIACIITLDGLAVTVWARSTLATNWSSDVALKQDHELVQRGPYKFVRHPIYTGLMMMLIGSSLAIRHVSVIPGLLLAFLSFWIKLKSEEKVMLDEFGQRYVDYQQKVKAIIPYIF